MNIAPSKTSDDYGKYKFLLLIFNTYLVF